MKGSARGDACVDNAGDDESALALAHCSPSHHNGRVARLSHVLAVLVHSSTAFFSLTRCNSTTPFQWRGGREGGAGGGGGGDGVDWWRGRRNLIYSHNSALRPHRFHKSVAFPGIRKDSTTKGSRWCSGAEGGRAKLECSEVINSATHDVTHFVSSIFLNNMVV